MKITRVSTLTEIERTIEIPITAEQLQRWENGELIQRVAPDLTPDEREFIITGVTPEEWEEHFGPDEE